MTTAEMPLDELTHRIIGAAIEVHGVLGPGLLESVYQECLTVELRQCDLVEGRVIVEVKAVEGLHPIHQAQVVTYLKLTGYPAGLLMNFNSIVLRSGLRRLDHPDLYVKKIRS